MNPAHYNPHERRVLPRVVSKQRLVLAGEGGDEGYVVHPLFLFVLAAIRAAVRSALPQEYGLTVGGIQRYKRLTLLSHFACVLIMLETTPADLTMRAWRNWQTRET